MTPDSKMRLSAIAKRLFPDFATRLVLRRIAFLPLDLWDAALGHRDELTPPRGLWFIGGGNFRGIGEQFLDYFIRFGKLKPDDRVLDVGCGIGRMAVPLTRYLSTAGSYEGLDIVSQGIEWCREHITPRYPNFKFCVAEIYSRHYNPHGRLEAASYRFPYPDGSFDFVFAASVFTHMLPDGVKNYIAEMSRVCKLGGRCLFTAFLLNKESCHLIASGKSTLRFQDGPQQYCMVIDPAFPETAVALAEQFVTDSLNQVALTVQDPPLLGSWCGRANWTSYQDMLVVQRQ